MSIPTKHSQITPPPPTVLPPVQPSYHCSVGITHHGIVNRRCSHCADYQWLTMKHAYGLTAYQVVYRVCCIQVFMHKCVYKCVTHKCTSVLYTSVLCTTPTNTPPIPPPSTHTQVLRKQAVKILLHGLMAVMVNQVLPCRIVMSLPCHISYQDRFVGVGAQTTNTLLFVICYYIQ